MPALSNPKHERFAQAVATGKTATEAYALAGYKPSQPSSARLLSNVMVQTRIAELQNAGSLRVEVTIASLIQEAAEIQQLAKADGQFAAATSALTAKAKLAGLWVDKNENTNRNVDPATVTDAELAAVVQADSSPRVTAPPVDPGKLN